MQIHHTKRATPQPLPLNKGRRGDLFTMSIASLIAQDIKSVKEMFTNAEMLAKIERITKEYQLFIVVCQGDEKAENKKDVLCKSNIYDVIRYDISQNIMASSQILVFIAGTDITIFHKDQS